MEHIENENKDTIISLRLNKSTEKKLNWLIKQFKEETGIDITKSQYIRYLLLQEVKKNEKEKE